MDESLPISSNSPVIQEETTCNTIEPRHFRLKKNLLIIIFTLSFLRKGYLLLFQDQKEVGLSEKLEEFNANMEKALASLNDSLTNDEVIDQVSSAFGEKVIKIKNVKNFLKIYFKLSDSCP